MIRFTFERQRELGLLPGTVHFLCPSEVTREHPSGPTALGEGGPREPKNVLLPITYYKGYGCSRWLALIHAWRSL